ncbi:MAG: signal peptide peptidase SppA [Micavibrio sp.]
MLGSLRRICIVLGAIVLLTAILAGVGAAILEKEETGLPRQMVLTLRLDDGVIERAAEADFFNLQGFGSSRMSVHEIIEALDIARNDPAVRGLAFSIEGGSFGISHVQEIRSAVKRFRESGKPTYAYSPSYLEAGGTMGAYYLASAFEQIWMQPVGLVALPGFDAEMPFVLEGLNKIGVNPQFFQRKEYKSVMESFTRKDMSPENREMTSSLLADIASVLAADIAADRSLSLDAVYDAIDRGLHTDREALDAKLVDRLDYGDVLISHLRESLTGDPENTDLKMVRLSHYNKAVDRDPVLDSMPVVGLIYAAGNIVADESGGGFSADVAAADKISDGITKAIRDSDIKVIVLRIDSPGGSPTASETIRRAVANAVERGKPVIVSMGGMAGSGGYWIATDATRIFALPSTLTGSIGVASGKADLSGLMEKIGVNWDGVQVGENADLWSMTGPFSQSGQERMNTMIDSTYDAFVERVAKGRKLSPEEVEKIARGRVWTGHQALEIGLVDELGGLGVALDYAARQIGAENRDGVEVVQLPHPKTPFERLFELMNIEVMMGKLSEVVTAILQEKAQQAKIPAASAYNPWLEQRL